MVIGLRIPPHAEPLVEKGQAISLEDPLIKVGETSTQHLDVAAALGIQPTAIFQHVMVQVGDSVTKGDILAEAKKFVSTKRFVSETDGIVTAIDHMQGTIGISSDTSAQLTLASFAEGTVDSINREDHIIYINIGPADAFEATCTQDCGGLLVQLTPRDYYSCDADDVLQGCVHMYTSPTHITSKLEALGARCIMAVEGPESELPYIRISAETSEKISKSSHTHVVYSLHDQKVYLYTPKK